MEKPEFHSRAGEKLWWRPSVAAAIIMAAFIVGVALRIFLALVNVEANDPHLPVIRSIAFEGHFPTLEQEWEGFQPKLYHTVTALIWRIMPTRDPYALTRAAQFVSCAAGILTLLVVLSFLRFLGTMSDDSSRAKSKHGVCLSSAVAFTAVALNPALVGTSVQATNDAFVILFASLTLYAGARVLAEARRRDFAALVLWPTFAGLSKGNGLVAIAAVLATFAIVVLIGGGAVQRRRAAVRGILIIAFVIVPIALIGPYYSHQRQYGTPFVTNMAPSAPPSFLHDTFTSRSGLTSIVSGLFTFRLVDLLRHPETTRDAHYPLHRTSLWSRLHAQAHSIHFEGRPRSWRARSPAILQLTRALILLGLVPTALIGWGFAVMVRDTALGWQRDQHNAAENKDALARRWPVMLLLLLTAGGYVAFQIIYSIRIRDFGVIKVIYILPALPAFAAALDLGMARLLAWKLARSQAGIWPQVAVCLVGVGLVLLFACYIADLGVLAAQLTADHLVGEVSSPLLHWKPPQLYVPERLR